MGALTNNRKRGDEYFSQGFPYFTSPYFPSYKRPRLLSSPKNPSLDRPAIAMSSSKSTLSRVSMYPKPNHQPKDIHAPTANHKFGSNSGVSNRRSDSEIGNFLTSRYKAAKSKALEFCRYNVKEKEKEVVELDSEVEEVVHRVSEDSNVEEIEIIEVNENDDDDDVQELEAKIGDGTNQPSSSSAASDLSNDTLKMESLSLGADGNGMSIDVYKKLLRKVDERSPIIEQLSFQIQLNEQKLATVQSLRLLKKPAKVIPREAFIVLTNEEEIEVKRAFSANQRRVLVVHENSNIEITGHLMQCLRPGAWLNDEVVNVYLELLKEREKREPKKFLKCHFFNTFFYKKISGNGYDYKSVRRWTTQRKLGYALLDCDKIFVPVHKEMHWCLAVINNKEKKFQYLDSLKGGDNRVMKVLARYYADEVKDKSGKDIDLSSWEQEFVEDLPEQKNGYDCGVFMIKYADFYSRDLGLCFSQENMPYFRLRTAKEILRLRAD